MSVSPRVATSTSAESPPRVQKRIRKARKKMKATAKPAAAIAGISANASANGIGSPVRQEAFMRVRFEVFTIVGGRSRWAARFGFRFFSTDESFRARPMKALPSSHATFRRGERRRSQGRSAGSLSLDYRELERQVAAISICRPRVVADMDVEKPFLDHHVSHDLLETTQRLPLQGPPQAQLSTVCPEPFAEFVPSGSRHVELFRALDLNACDDVMALHGYAMNATQLRILLATEHDRAGQEHAS
jgi:hypothetical protein